MDKHCHEIVTQVRVQICVKLTWKNQHFSLASSGICGLLDVAGDLAEPVPCVNCFDVIVGHVTIL
jgi:hypothetical protein